MRVIEIIGGGVRNKGAELMLRTVLKHLSEEEFLLCSKPGTERGDLPYCHFGRLGMQVLADFDVLGRLGLLLSRATPTNVINRFGLVHPRQVDVVLDISGFKYSSEIDNKEVQRALFREKFYSKKVRVIYLPQAFGPFDSSKTQDFRKLLGSAELVYARDKRSSMFLREIGISHERVVDITVSLSFNQLERRQRRVLIIPNRRLIEKGIVNTRKEYAEIITKLISRLNGLGFDGQILIHETKDRDFFEGLFDYLYFDDSLKLKEYIAESHMVVSGRYHGVVSALSTNTPCVSTSWSHKYEELMDDYGIRGCCVRDLSNLERTTIDILNANRYKDIRTKLEERNLIHKDSLSRMWLDVRKTIS